jgi:hypothetical protein
LWFRTVHAFSVIAPVGSRAIRINEGEFELSGAFKGFSIDRDLPSIIQNRWDSVRPKGKQQE